MFRAPRLYPRHRLDITLRTMLAGLAACLTVRARETHERELCDRWAGEEAIACLSVRSAFDMLLTSVDFTPGAEIVMSAVTIPAMAEIATAHGLRVVPVDIDRATLAPSPAAIEAAMTPRTCAVVVAHLFGGSNVLAPIAATTRRRSVLLVEDCAQALRAPDDIGDPDADVSLFSFGPIKTATCFGGALARVSDAELRMRMCEVAGYWEIQTRRAFLVRVVRYSLLAALCTPRLYALLARVIRGRGRDFDAFISRAAKGFGSYDDVEVLLDRIRMRPSAPQLRMLGHRLERFPTARIWERSGHGNWLTARLPRHATTGTGQDRRSHWVLPVVADEPAALVELLYRHGFDATRTGTTSVDVITALGSTRTESTPVARELLRRMVFVPAYPELSHADLEWLGELVASHCFQHGPVTTPRPLELVSI